MPRVRYVLRALPAAAAVILTASGCSLSFPGDPGSEETRVFREDFSDGEVFDLRNINGAVRIESWEEEDAEISARKVATNPAALRDLTIEVRRTSDGLRVRTRHAKRVFGQGWNRHRGRVHYQVKLPASAEVRVETVNGPVDIAGFHGRVKAQTINGRIRMEDQRGQVTAKTINGPIECDLEELGAGADHSFRTVNGTVELTLGPGSRGEVDAQAMNGRVRLDLPGAENLKVPTRRGKKVRIGDGAGGTCHIRTMNGAILVASRDD